MRPQQNKNKTPQAELFRSELRQIIDLKHPLAKLAEVIDWNRFYEFFGTTYCPDNGRPAIDTRLMVCLHYLKYLKKLSDEETVQLWVENPYWQYFSGMKYFCCQLPIDASSMTRWRKRVESSGAKELLDETIKSGLKLKFIKSRELEKVNVDTTTQEKAIRFPTDSCLYERARARLVALAEQENIHLRQNYNRKAKMDLLMQSRYRKARQLKRARRCTKNLKCYLGRIIRDIERNCDYAKLSAQARQLLATSRRIYEQQQQDKNKVYSVHATEVACITKGKAHKKYEFGNKVSIATTTKNNWIVASLAFVGSPYDGHTLKSTLEQISGIVGFFPKQVFVDAGYKGHDCTEEIKEGRMSTQVYVDQKRRGKIKRGVWEQLKRRARIEPIIGHLKNDHHMGRNLLKGTEGDAVNATLSAAGMNLRKLLKLIELFCFKISWEWFVFVIRRRTLGCF